MKVKEMMTATELGIRTSRTKHKQKVYDPDNPTLSRVLGLGVNNRKLGGTVKKGRFKGYTIRTVTLEERATCPKSCLHWGDCYGNNMPWAKRVNHDSPYFLPRLEAEIDAAVADAKVGVLARLHVLGDFYSADYVSFWRRMLEKHSTLAAWGYTARRFGNISEALDRLFQDYEASGRFIIRTSDTRAVLGTRTIDRTDQCPADAFICPVQTGKTKSCATCAACWEGTKNVAFLRH